MPNKKLTYFNGRGRGELIRLILSSQNEKFDDERLTFEQWAPRKPSMKYGQLPVLTLESGVQMNESFAIARYLARKAHLYGNDEWEMYLIDRSVDTIIDLMIKGAQAHFEKDETKKAELMKDLKENLCPQYLGNLVKYIEEGKGDFLAGSKPTLADFCLCALYENFKESMAHFPKLENIYTKMLETYPGMKAYIDTRPQTPF